MLRLVGTSMLLGLLVLRSGMAAAEDPSTLWNESAPTYFSSPERESVEALWDDAPVACDECCPCCNCTPCCCWDYCCRPLWSINAGAIFLTRSAPHHSPIIRDGGNATTLLNASALDFDWATGPDVQVTRRVDGTCAIDALSVRYFGVQSLVATASVDTGGPWQFPNSTAPLPSGVLDSVYRSQLYSTELNAHHHIACSGLTLLAGFRWVQLNDQLSIVNSSTAVQYDATTQNNLYGAQFGLIVDTLADGGPFSIRWTSKAGVYGNAARNYWTADAARLSSDSQGQLAFVGDVNVLGVWRLSDHISLEGGYQLLWVEQVALASDQFAVMQQATTQTGINTGGGAFFHGALASVNVHW